ncbi:Ca-activated chloride channel homolog [Gammaproteobacteria bacterium]
MFDFQWPWIALLLPLPLSVWWYSSKRQSKTVLHSPEDRAVLLHPALEHLQASFVASPFFISPQDRFRLPILIGVWCALVLSLMGPRLLEQKTQETHSGHDLMLAVDASGSMKGMDFALEGEQVTRMAVVKGVASRFIEKRHGDRVGLILFGEQAILQTPLTLDTDAVSQFLQYAEPGVAGDGTAIGDAIALAVKKLWDRPEGARILVLVTDGENTSGMAPTEAAQLAKKYGVRIHSIGVGSKGKIPFQDEKGHLEYRDDLTIDDELLSKIAQLTGGTYFRATDTQGLEKIYREIDALEKTNVEVNQIVLPSPLYRWPLGVALLGLLILVLI